MFLYGGEGLVVVFFYETRRTGMLNSLFICCGGNVYCKFVIYAGVGMVAVSSLYMLWEW